MADEKTPRPKIETAEKTGEQRDDRDRAASGAPADEAPYGVSDAARDGMSRLRGWVASTFPGHEHAFWGGVCGLLAAILFFVIGLWRALVVAVLVTLGVAVGQAIDGDARIVRTLRRLFSRNQ